MGIDTRLCRQVEHRDVSLVVKYARRFAPRVGRPAEQAIEPQVK